MGDQDLTIKDAAAKLGRSYSWVRDHLTQVGNAGCYKKRGVIHINPLGFKTLVELNTEAAKGVRPKRRRSAGGGWVGEP